jgi:hypothetical protein
MLYIYYQGRAIFGSRSPFDPVKYKKLVVPAQVREIALYICEVLTVRTDL